MRFSEIKGIFINYFTQAVVAFVFLAIISSIIYSIFCCGKRKVNITKIILPSLFSIYIIMVIGVTFFSRSVDYQWGTNFSIIATYKDVWNNYSLRAFQGIVLNMFMFTPFGLLLPFIFKKIKSYKSVIVVSFIFSLTIECLQYVLNRGIFDISDIIHNVVGAVIGYGFFCFLLTLYKKRRKHSVLHLLPSLIVILLFVLINLVYEMQPYGNLSIAYSKPTKVKDAEINSHVEFSNIVTNKNVFRAPTLSKEEAEAFVRKFYSNIPGNKDINLDIINYQTTGLYWDHGTPTYSLWFNYLDSTYTFTNFTVHESSIVKMDSSQTDILKKLNIMGIDIPKIAQFTQTDIGTYEWQVDFMEQDGQLINGKVQIEHYSNNEIMSINNNLVHYDVNKKERILSEKEAFELLKAGKFKLYMEETIESIDIYNIKIGYLLDSKGYYQPIYVFNCFVNEEEREILIPALK